MCYHVQTDFSDIDVMNTKEFEITSVEKKFQTRLDAFPGQDIPVIIPGSRILTTLKWGLIPHWAKDEKISKQLANARSETIDKLPSFKDCFQSKRCLVLVSGFYEWDKSKIRHFIELKNQKIFAFAALYDVWVNPQTKQEIKTCTIITCPPNEFVGKIHSRMPVIIHQKDYQKWLTSTDKEQLKSLLVPYNQEMQEKIIPKIKAKKYQKTLL